jgi:exonuclease III
MSPKFNVTNIIRFIITIYISSTGNYDYFSKNLEFLLNLLYTKKNEFIIYGDININYLHSHNRRQMLYILLAMYSLKSTVNFPTRTFNGSSTVIDNIFIDLSRNFTINPLINGHDAQLLILEKSHCTNTRIHILLC